VFATVSDLRQQLAAQHYVADRGLAVSIFLASKLQRPLFLEGEAGVGKTAVASAVAGAQGADLIRLQCYEGLDISHAVYEWDYARQLMELRILEATGSADRGQVRRELYSEPFLIKRPLLQAIDPARTRPGLPARTAGRVPDHDPRARYGSRDTAATRDPHVEPDP
jgi:MoxR-like ATPase